MIYHDSKWKLFWTESAVSDSESEIHIIPFDENSGWGEITQITYAPEFTDDVKNAFLSIEIHFVIALISTLIVIRKKRIKTKSV
jgi:hypothetical protein